MMTRAVVLAILICGKLLAADRIDYLDNGTLKIGINLVNAMRAPVYETIRASLRMACTSRVVPARREPKLARCAGSRNRAQAA